VRESIAMGIPTPVITAALMARFATQGRDDYAAKFLAELRHAFGGHAKVVAGTDPVGTTTATPMHARSVAPKG
jgi:6-phosphogluconate dehydrogenase (decarboxylating)